MGKNNNTLRVLICFSFLPLNYGHLFRLVSSNDSKKMRDTQYMHFCGEQLLHTLNHLMEHIYPIASVFCLEKQKFPAFNDRIRNFRRVARLFSRLIRQMHSTARLSVEKSISRK